MAKVIFWEKPGCKGNARQKEILLQSGHELDVRNLLEETWTADILTLFFRAKPVEAWFNKTNPRIKSGAVRPEELTPREALDMMVVEPLLIGRPLIQVGEERMSGFDPEILQEWIGLKQERVGLDDPRNCPCVGSEV